MRTCFPKEVGLFVVDPFVGQPFFDVWEFVFNHIGFPCLAFFIDERVWFQIAPSCVAKGRVCVGLCGVCLCGGWGSLSLFALLFANICAKKQIAHNLCGNVFSFFTGGGWNTIC